MCLDLGKRVGLDIAAITKSVVEHIRNIGMVCQLPLIKICLLYFTITVRYHSIDAFLKTIIICLLTDLYSLMCVCCQFVWNVMK